MGETIAAAGLHAEMVDEKRASMAAERRASVVTDPHAPAPAVAVPAGGVTPDGQFPTPEEMESLRRISNKIPLKLFSIAFIEMCERFSYYGSTVVCKFAACLLSLILFILTHKSHKLHSAASSSWFHHRCRRRAAWCPRNGPASLDRYHHFQPVLAVLDAPSWSLPC